MRTALLVSLVACGTQPAPEHQPLSPSTPDPEPTVAAAPSSAAPSSAAPSSAASAEPAPPDVMDQNPRDELVTATDADVFLFDVP